MKRHFLSLCVAIALVLSTLTFAPMTEEAQAISRYTTTSMSCGAIRSAVRNQGAVILGWTSRQTGNPIYARYVAGTSYCGPSQRAVPASVPSASGQCTVKKCRRCDFDRDGFGSFGC